VRLVPGTRVDLHEAAEVARRLIDGGAPQPDDIALLSDDLLPTWNEPFARTERQRWHEIRVERWKP
jgi:hypothetical protein